MFALILLLEKRSHLYVCACEFVRTIIWTRTEKKRKTAKTYINETLRQYALNVKTLVCALVYLESDLPYENIFCALVSRLFHTAGARSVRTTHTRIRCWCIVYYRTHTFYKHLLPVTSIFIVPVSHLQNWFLSCPLLRSTIAARRLVSAWLTAWRNGLTSADGFFTEIYNQMGQPNADEYPLSWRIAATTKYCYRTWSLTHFFPLIHSLANQFLDCCIETCLPAKSG